MGYIRDRASSFAMMRRGGYSLAEMAVVLLLLALVVAIAVPSYRAVRESSSFSGQPALLLLASSDAARYVYSNPGATETEMLASFASRGLEITGGDGPSGIGVVSVAVRPADVDSGSPASVIASSDWRAGTCLVAAVLDVSVWDDVSWYTSSPSPSCVASSLLDRVEDMRASRGSIMDPRVLE